MTTLAKIQSTTLQFNGSDAVSANLRRLVQDLVATETAVNTLIGLANQVTPPDDTVPPHVLATTTGLQSDHTVSGLVEGLVLMAIAANNAAFRRLQFSDIQGSDISNAPSNGQVIQYVDGFWIAVDLDIIGGSTGLNIGGGDGIYAGNSGSVLQFKSFMEGVGIAFDVSSTSIKIRLEVIPADTLLGSLSGGQPIALTGTEVTTMLDVFTTLLKGLVPPPGSVAGNVLSDNGTWIAPGASLDVDDGVTSVTDVTLIKFTSGATVTAGAPGEADVAISGGGGGTLVLNANITPDFHPQNPSARDDEFEETTLATKWIWGNQVTSTATLAQGAMTLNVVPTDADIHAIQQNLAGSPTTPFKYRTKLLLQNFGQFNHTGLMLRESSTGKIMTFGIPFSTSAADFQVTTFNSYLGSSFAGTLVNGLTDLPGIHSSIDNDFQEIYLEIENTGTNYVYRLSKLGYDEHFFAVYTGSITTFFTTGADQIGIFAISQNSSNIAPVPSYDWFRDYTAGYTPATGLTASSTVEDGVNTVAGVSTFKFTGAAVSGTTPNVTVAVNITPDSHPLTPTIYDDEFEEASISSQWTFFNQGASTATLVDGGCIEISGSLAAIGVNLFGETLPSGGAWKFRAKIAVDLLGTSNLSGLGLYDSVSGQCCIFSPFNGFAALIVGSGILTAGLTTINASGPTLFPDWNYAIPTPFKYFEIELASGTLFFRTSNTGLINSFVNFFSIALTSIFATGPDNIGLAVQSNNGSTPAGIFADWFRRIS